MNGLDFGTAIGLIKGLGSPDPAVIESAVSDWLNDHPEATTTVQDGSITKAKLDSNLQGTVDDVANLKSQMLLLDNRFSGTGRSAGSYTYDYQITSGKTYKFTNTSSSTTVNLNLRDASDNVLEVVKTSIAVGENVQFTADINAPKIGVYYASGAGSFTIAQGFIVDYGIRLDALEDDSAIANQKISALESANNASMYKKTVTLESGRYTGTATVGQAFNPNKTTDSAWECVKFPVSAYDKITVYGIGTDGTLLWVLTDSDNVVISKANGAISAPSTNPAVILPVSDGYVYCNCIKANAHGVEHYLVNGYADVLADAKQYTDEAVSGNGKYVYPLEFDFDVTKIPVQSDFSITSHNPQDIYDLYDGLMASYPQYITRVDCSEADSVLGVTRPSYLEGLPIYLYKFSPNIINTQVSIKRKVKIMVLTGVHSNEKWNIYNVYRILKYICENWATDKNSATIRTLVEFWIIPVVNPWGFVNVDTIQYAGRVNGNGVNLNRNAPASNWQLAATGPDYSGPSAGSEYETKVWLYYHDQFKPDVFIDQHTPGMPETGIFGVLETDITKEYLANAGDVICREISNHLIINDQNTPDSADACLFDMFSDTNYGAVTLCAREHGTPYSFLFEMSDSSKWDNGVLTDHTVTSASSGIQIRLQMQNIYGAWQRLLYYASHDYLH